MTSRTYNISRAMTCLLNCYSHIDAPRYSEELKESIATHVLGVKLLLGAELEFNGEETYDLASKVRGVVTCKGQYY